MSAACLMTVPLNLALAASVVAPVGVQKTSLADAPLANATLTTDAPLSTVLSAPVDLKMYLPVPLRVIPVPVVAAPVMQ